MNYVFSVGIGAEKKGAQMNADGQDDVPALQAGELFCVVDSWASASLQPKL